MKLNNETKIGLMVVATIVLLGYLTWKTGKINFYKEGYLVEARFYKIDGVNVNAPVHLNGLEVGEIRDIKISYGEETKMILTLWLQMDAKLREGSKASIKTMGLLGEKFVELTAGEKNKPYLQPGSVVEGQEPADLQKLLADGEDLAEKLKQISTNINERLEVNKEKIDEILTSIDTATKNIASITENVDESFNNNKHLVDDMVENLSGASSNLEELSYDLKINPWKLLYRPKQKIE